MVSRYGVSKEGAVGVAVGVGPMHCILPHCGGPHHHHHLSAPHPQNPQGAHNHHVHPAHQPPPSPSPHLNQLSHHQLTVNINHLNHHQQQQQQQQQFRVVSNNRSDFHVSGQSYGTQPGGQVGGGGGSVGVPGGRGPPPLGGLPSIGQSAGGIPPGGPAGGQAPPQTPAPGVQSQAPQGPTPTTTPPVHTPSPQEMGKQPHLQPQPQSIQQVYGQQQTRPQTQPYYQGSRQQQPRALNHRAGQGGSGGGQVVSMPGVAGGGGQMYSGAMVQTGLYQVGSLHPNAHQPVYSHNLPIQVFGGPAQRHQPHQNQPYFQPFPQASTTLITPNMFGYATTTPNSYYWSTSQPTNTPLISRPGANTVTGGAQHVTGLPAGAQGAPVVPQGAMQQPTQQPQIPPMGLSLTQPDVYTGHNGGATNSSTNTVKSRKPRGQNAITDIVDPSTGKNISHEIYKDETIQSSDSSNRHTPLQNNDAEVQADFAAKVAKTLIKIETDESSSDSTVSTSVPNTQTTQSLSNSQKSSNIDTNSLSNSSSTTLPNVPCSQSIVNTVAVDSCAVKPESKPLQISVKEFQPRNELKSVVTEEPPSAAPVNINKEISVQFQTMNTVEVETKSAAPTVTQAPAPVSLPSTNVPEVPKPSVTAPIANPIPAREPFPNLANRHPSNSPPRRKSQTRNHNQPTATVAVVAPTATTELQCAKDRKAREKSLSCRGGSTPTPAHNQVDHHSKPNGDVTNEKIEPELPRTEVQQQKPSDGKAAQKSKNKNKLKPRDLNRKGAEKEGTDMDAFVNTVPPAKAEAKQENKDTLASKDTNKDANREITKDLKDKDNYESKKEKEVASSVHAKTEKPAAAVTTSEIPKENVPVQIDKPSKDVIKESSPKIEDSNKLNVCNTQDLSVPNDVVDHAILKEESSDNVQAIIAQKNEENSKNSLISIINEEQQVTSPVIEKSGENESSAQAETTPVTNQIQLKYKYKEDQWSPVNRTGKKVYDREFLMKLQDDPNSKIKPSNLPDLDVVLKDNNKSRSTADLRSFKDVNINNRHDLMFPGFVKPTQMNARMPPPNRKSHPGKSSKPAKGNIIHVSLSLREDVKLKETENAWKPTRLKNLNLSEEEAKTEALYKRVRSVLNKLTPQKFSTLVDQVRKLNIDTPERLQGVIDLVFEKAVDEPSFSVAYALMCKELGMMQVSGADTTNKNSDKQEFSLSFKKLIINRCQKEFERNPINEMARAKKLKEIEETTDPEKKKDLQLAFEEEERRIRIKSVGNIRFIGELYKQEMLTAKIMYRCIKELLNQSDEDSLECLCKLLTTIGKDLESSKNNMPEEMQDCFNKMQDIVSRRNQVKISSRIRFMLQDVIDLKANKWIPRRDDANPKTIDQIQKEAESERLDSQLNNTSLNTPRKDERSNDRKRNRGIGPTDDAGWSQPVRTRTTYSVETAKLKNKPPPMDDLLLGNRNTYMWKPANSTGKTTAPTSTNKFACLSTTMEQERQITTPQLSGSRSTGPRDYGDRREYKSSYDGRSSRNGNQYNGPSTSRDNSLLENTQSQSVSMPPPTLKLSQSTPSTPRTVMSDQDLTELLTKILNDYLKSLNKEKATLAIQQNFDNALTTFMRELINFVMEKSPNDREQVSSLLTHLITQQILPIAHVRNGLMGILDVLDDLVIDIPKLWTYLAEILSHPIENDLFPLNELKPILRSEKLRSEGCVGKFLGELLAKLSEKKGDNWVAVRWDQSGLQLRNIIDNEREDIDKLVKEYNLDFCIDNGNRARSAITHELTYPQIHDELLKVVEATMKCDTIIEWILANVHNSRTREPEFIRVLVTVLVKRCCELQKKSSIWKFDKVLFRDLQPVLNRFIDANETFELQCLYATQLYIHSLQYPSGVLFDCMTVLADCGTISHDAFVTWKENPEPEQREWHGVACMALTSFFTGLEEAGSDIENEQDEEEPTSAASSTTNTTNTNQAHC